jgi:hypothetical protein
MPRPLRFPSIVALLLAGFLVVTARAAASAFADPD